MGYFAGLDVSLEETAVCVVDDAGRIVREARVASEPEELVAFFAEARNVAVVRAIAGALTAIEPEAAVAGGALDGKLVVFTGTLATMTRPEARAIAERSGARVTNTVSSRTDLVVLGAGAGAGRKAQRAAELGVRTIDEAGFRALTEGLPPPKPA